MMNFSVLHLFLITFTILVGLRLDCLAEEIYQFKDQFKNLEELKSHFQSGKDYRILEIDKNSPVTILAIHGGLIEFGTSQIAKSLAKNKYNLYLFEGLLSNNPKVLHITATHFKDPDLIKLLKKSQLALAIHGYGTEANREIWLGGLNTSFKDKIAKNLAKSGFTVNTNSPRYGGRSVYNIVNYCPNYGCQIELPDDLLSDMLKHKSLYNKFIKAVSKAIIQELG